MFGEDEEREGRAMTTAIARGLASCLLQVTFIESTTRTLCQMYIIAINDGMIERALPCKEHHVAVGSGEAVEGDCSRARHMLPLCTSPEQSCITASAPVWSWVPLPAQYRDVAVFWR